jgi:hypothetical protein
MKRQDRYATAEEYSIAVLLSIFLATTVYYASSELAARRGHRAEAVQHQLAIALRQPMIIDGTPSDISEYRSRVFVPYILMTLAHNHLLHSDEQRYGAVRLVTGTIMFLAVWLFSRIELRVTTSLAAMLVGLLAAWFVTSFNIPWEVPTDFIDVIVLLIGIALVRRGHRLALIALVALSTLNRESSAYIGVLFMWSAALEPQPKLRRYAFGLGLIALAVTEMVVLRTLNRLPGADLHNHFMLLKNVSQLGVALSGLPAPGWLVPLFTGGLVLIVWLRLRADFATAMDIALTRTALTILVPTWMVTNVGELRVYLPSVFLALIAVVQREQRFLAVESIGRPSEP